jgi:hypothetical protein
VDADEPVDPTPDLDDALQPVLQRVQELVERLRLGPVSPLGAAAFEKDLQQATRELARVTTQWTYNPLEADAVQALPREIQFESSAYRRLAQKTPQEVSTLFGTITLRRLGYRAAPDVGAPVLFPLCQELGLGHGATPAVVERVAHYLAQSGATQQQTLERLRREHGLSWGVKRLRQVSAFVAAAMEEPRAEAQAEPVRRWLAPAPAWRGRHRPVLRGGREGLPLGVRIHGGALYAVAPTGTLRV